MKKKTYASGSGIVLAAIALMIIGSACGVRDSFSPPRRKVKRRIQQMTAGLADSRWEKVHAMCHKKFVWIRDDKKRETKAAEKFLLSLKKIRHTSFKIHIETLKVIDENKVILTVRFQQVVPEGMGQPANFFWTCDMVWVKVDKEWKLKLLRETSPHVYSRGN